MYPWFSLMTSCRTGGVLVFLALLCLLTSPPGSAQPTDALFWPARLDYPIGSWSRSVSIGDLHGDNVPDLVVGCLDIAVLLGQEDGTFAPASFYYAGHGFHHALIVDLNGDEILDIAAASTGPDEMVVLLGQGDGSFAAPIIVETGEEPSSIAIGDIDGDDLLDLAITHIYADDVLILLGHGDATFSRAGLYGASNAATVVIAEFNGDDVPDLAVANGHSHDVAVLLGTRAGSGVDSFDPRSESCPLALAATNPAAAPASITFVLPETGRARLWVADVGGRLVAPLLDRTLTAGTHHAIWDLTGNDGRCMPAGMYFVTLEAGGRHAAQRVIVVR